MRTIRLLMRAMSPAGIDANSGPLDASSIAAPRDTTSRSQRLFAAARDPAGLAATGRV